MGAKYICDALPDLVFNSIFKLIPPINLHNLKNVKNTYGGKLLNLTLLDGCFARFLNCANGNKSRKASHMYWR